MADNKRRFSWPVPVGDGLLLLCALLGSVGSFLSLYGDPDVGLRAGTALDRCAANEGLFLACAVLFGLAALYVWSLPRRWGAAAGGLTGLWAVCVLWNRAELVQGAGVTVREISVLFARRVAWGRIFFYESGLRRAQKAAVVQLFLLLILAGLALLLGWAVVRSRRWWVVVLLTLPPLLPGLLADLYPNWLPFMALMACWCAMLLTSLCRWAAPDRRGKLTLTVLPCVALTLALITAFFPREGYTRPAWTQKVQEDMLNFTNRLSDYLPHWENGPFRSAVTYVGATGEADLARAGPLNYSGRTVLRVTSDRGGWMYLRGSSLAVYEDGVWKSLPDGTYGDYWSGQEPEVSPLFLPAALEQDSPVYTVTVNNIGAVGTCVYAPYFLLPPDADETGVLPVEDAYLARKQGQWTHTMTFVDRNLRGILDIGDYRPGDGFGDPGGIDEGFTVYGGEPDMFAYDSAGRLARSAAPAYAEYVYGNYLDVPEDLREILVQYVWAAGMSVASSYYSSYYDPTPFQYSGDPILMAVKIGSFLDANCQYDASAPAAPEGVDPIYYFLTESQRGYCMHYASAATLMLRAAGVPARYVSGFAADIPKGRQTDVPDRAAHAWVEVWVDGFGWYPVEVTPAVAFDWARQPFMPETDRPDEDTPVPLETPEPTPEPIETPKPTDAPDQSTDALPGGGDLDGPGQTGHGPNFAALFNVLRKAAPVLGALLLIWSVQFVIKCLRVWRMSGADANRSALVCYGYLCRLERWGGRVEARAVELAQKARFSHHTLTREELDTLRYLVARERARLCVVTGLPTRLVFRYWWGKTKPPVPPADWTPPQEE